MENPNYYKLTIDLLNGLAKAAIANAGELIEEAKVLYAANHFARAYFLAVASIEETGKSQIAFDGQGRKIEDTSIAAKIKKHLEDHSAKITSAFVPWMNDAKDIRSEVMNAVELMVMLKNGREPSMYTDIHLDGKGIHLPSEKVRPVAARDCIRLAMKCFDTAQKKMGSGIPPKQTTRNQDLLYSMKSKEYEAILKTEDYWWYALDLMEKKRFVFEDAILEYKAVYMEKGIKYSADLPRSIDG
jgi:AbiV family abortive infection protein